MKTPRKAPAFLISLIGLLPVAYARAASLSLVVTPSHATAADAFYPGAGSTVTSATDSQSGLSFAVSGRNYGVDPNPAQTRWGIRNGQSLANPANGAFIVTNGFTPAAAGSKTTSTGGTASYVSIKVGNVLPNTLFQNLSIDFNGLSFTRTTNAWAATNAGNFSNWVAATQTNEGANGRRLSMTLPSFTWEGTEPLEIRVYGITGTDEGQFASIRISAGITGPTVPEPAAATSALLAAAGLLLRRRRK